MSFEIRTEIRINASAEKVWKVLMDFQNYEKWNPFIKKIEGDPKVGNKIYAEIDGMKFKPEVLVNRKEEEFKWIGKLLFKGVFDGEHRFQIEELGNGQLKFTQSEKFYGFLVPVFKKKLNTDTIKGFMAMNEKIKEEAEK